MRHCHIKQMLFVVSAVFLTTAASPTIVLANNVWIGAGVGLWIEFDFPVSLVLDDIHFPAAVASQHFQSGAIQDLNDYLGSVSKAILPPVSGSVG